MPSKKTGITLRSVRQTDLEIFFQNQQDPEANWMAAFTAKDPSDRDVFDVHWDRILNSKTVVIRTVEYQGQVAGFVLKYELDGDAEISYWIGREFWGKGIATLALKQFIHQLDIRPLHARAATDNSGSIRVLEKCGFVRTGTERGFANARGKEIEEKTFILKLPYSCNNL